MPDSPPSTRLLRDVRATIKPQWKIRVTITRVRAGSGETELARFLVRGSDLAGLADHDSVSASGAGHGTAPGTEAGSAGPLTVSAASDSAPQPVNLAGFRPSDLQQAILVALIPGPMTSGEIADECDVSTGRLFDRGKVMHELIGRGLVVKSAPKGYELTPEGLEYAERLGGE